MPRIAQGDVIGEPQFKAFETQIQTFDFVVADPPFSAKAWGSGLTSETNFGWFDLGMPPDKNGDFAFLLHILGSMKAAGFGAVILPHGVLFRGNKEAELREKILKRGYIKAIIGLPANLFYGTGIPASIIVLDKSEASGFCLISTPWRLPPIDLYSSIGHLRGQWMCRSN